MIEQAMRDEQTGRGRRRAVAIALRRAGLPALAAASALLLSAAVSMGVLAPARAADAPRSGEALYQQRCASCHDHPTGRTPPKSVLSNLSPANLMNIMADGIMQPNVHGLVLADVASIANYLSQVKSVQDNPAAWEAPPCKTAQPPLRLNTPGWNGWGAGSENHRFQADPGLAATDVSRLKPKWAIKFAGARSGQPTLVDGRLFIVNTSGAVFSLDARTGCAYWRFEDPSMVRTTITVAPIKTGKATRLAAFFNDYNRTVHALDARTGKLIWKAHIDDQPGASGTGSPTFYKGKLFVPVTSAEELYAINDAYPCCRFRGAVVALDANSGKQLWKTFAIPEEAKPIGTNAKGVTMYGPSGAAIWSAPTVDARRGVIYVATGNSYTESPNIGSESILAIAMADGAIRSRQQLTVNHPSVMNCYMKPPPANCPAELGPDYDFGASPVLVTPKGGRQALLVGQKSSQIYSLDPDAGGKVIWSKRFSPGGPQGGVEWGMATDGDKLYAAIADIFVYKDAHPGLNALKISDGSVVWQTPSPTLPCRWKNDWCSPGLSQAITAMPGVIFSGALNGWLRAYNSTDGKVLWTYDTTQSVDTFHGPTQGGVLDFAGPVVSGGMVFVNSGYSGRQDHATSVLLAFSVDGK